MSALFGALRLPSSVIIGCGQRNAIGPIAARYGARAPHGGHFAPSNLRQVTPAGPTITAACRASFRPPSSGHSRGRTAVA